MNQNRFILIFTCGFLSSGLTLSAHSQTVITPKSLEAPELVKPIEPVKPNDPTRPFPIHPTRSSRNFLPPLLDRSAFPAYDKDSYAKMRMKQTRASTVWQAPTSKEKSMLQSVSENQLQQGVEDPQSLAMSWKAAEYFCKIQKYNQAEPLLKELVATIESHPQTPQSKAILGEAKKKLIEIDEARTKRFLPGPVKYQYPGIMPRRGLIQSPSSSSSSGSSSSSSTSSTTRPYTPPVSIPSNYREVPGVEFEIRSKSGFDYNKLRGN